jgi:hypothetical protein
MYRIKNPVTTIGFFPTTSINSENIARKSRESAKSLLPIASSMWGRYCKPINVTKAAIENISPIRDSWM